jgi:hypothetical protein
MSADGEYQKRLGRIAGQAWSGPALRADVSFPLEDVDPLSRDDERERALKEEASGGRRWIDWLARRLPYFRGYASPGLALREEMREGRQLVLGASALIIGLWIVGKTILGLECSTNQLCRQVVERDVHSVGELLVDEGRQDLAERYERGR